jgi:hypothetical protein
MPYKGLKKQYAAMKQTRDSYAPDSTEPLAIANKSYLYAVPLLSLARCLSRTF